MFLDTSGATGRGYDLVLFLDTLGAIGRGYDLVLFLDTSGVTRRGYDLGERLWPCVVPGHIGGDRKRL